MKIFFSEFHNNYSTYTFSYAAYCIMQEISELPSIYSQGFLPYSADFTEDRDLFYLCRSVRVNLDKFSDTSENRRVNRKVEPLGISWELVPKSNFDTADARFMHMVSTYTAQRFQGGGMSASRLEYVLSRNFVTHFLVFSRGVDVVGYVLLGYEGNSMHYYYAFFDTAYLHEYSLGKWMMWKSIHIAQEYQAHYIYLGTCYGEKALYKIRDHKGIEFFDGVRWNSDLIRIVSLVDSDGGTSKEADQFKQPGLNQLKISLAEDLVG